MLQLAYKNIAGVQKEAGGDYVDLYRGPWEAAPKQFFVDGIWCSHWGNLWFTYTSCSSLQQLQKFQRNCQSRIRSVNKCLHFPFQLNDISIILVHRSWKPQLAVGTFCPTYQLSTFFTSTIDRILGWSGQQRFLCLWFADLFSTFFTAWISTKFATKQELLQYIIFKVTVFSQSVNRWSIHVLSEWD